MNKFYLALPNPGDVNGHLAGLCRRSIILDLFGEKETPASETAVMFVSVLQTFLIN